MSVKATALMFLLMTRAFGILSVSRAQTEELPSVESILDAVIAQNNLIPPYSSQSVSTLRWSRPEGSGTSITEYDFRWNGLKSDYIGHRYDLTENEKAPAYSYRTIWDGTREISKQVAMTSSQDTSMLVGLSKGGTSHLTLDDRSFGTYLSRFGGSEKSFVELLRQSPNLAVRTQTDTVDGHSCYVLEGSTSKGYLRVWIDPSAGFGIRKIVNEKKSESEVSEVVIDRIEIRMVDNVWIPMSATYHAVQKDWTGEIRNDVTKAEKRTQIEFNPDFEKLGAFKMDGVPNGTRVIDFDFRGILYEWQNGNIVPYVDKATIDSIDEAARQIIENGEVPPKLVTAGEKVENAQAAPNAPQVAHADDAEVQPEVRSKTKTRWPFVLIPAGLLVVAVLGLRVFRRRGRQRNRNGEV